MDDLNDGSSLDYGTRSRERGVFFLFHNNNNNNNNKKRKENHFYLFVAVVDSGQLLYGSVAAGTAVFLEFYRVLPSFTELISYVVCGEMASRLALGLRCSPCFS